MKLSVLHDDSDSFSKEVRALVGDNEMSYTTFTRRLKEALGPDFINVNDPEYQRMVQLIEKKRAQARKVRKAAAVGKTVKVRKVKEPTVNEAPTYFILANRALAKSIHHKYHYPRVTFHFSDDDDRDMMTDVILEMYPGRQREIKLPRNNPAAIIEYAVKTIHAAWKVVQVKGIR